MKNASPFTIGIIMIIIIGLIMQIPFDKIITENNFSLFQIEYIILTLKMSLIFTFGILFIKKLRIESISGLSSNYKWKSKALNLIPVYLFLIGITAFISKDLSVINISNSLLLLLACLAVGFAEEFMFRGVLQSLFLKKYMHHRKGVFLGVLFPAIFFGASHLLNLMVNDNIPQVITQAIYAIFIGFFFGVLLLKTNKLLPIAITHGLINFFFLFNSLPSLNNIIEINGESPIEIPLMAQILGSIIPILIFLPLFIIGLILIRKINKEHIRAKIKH